jgi:hypothetical protein
VEAEEAEEAGGDKKIKMFLFEHLPTNFSTYPQKLINRT